MEIHIRLSSEAEQIILELQKEKGLSSVNKTLEYIVMDYRNNINIAENVSTKVAEDLSKVLTRIRLGTNAADINSQVMLELLNAIIFQFNVAPMTTETAETTAMTVSKQYIKNKIAAFKQRKDDKSKKQEDKS